MAVDDEQARALERGRLLFAQHCEFVAGAATLGALPRPGLPEIAFAGRSNVGKSSLINALTGRRTLARISQTPGRTRQINFFSLAGTLVLVDLPGYGFARASKAGIRAWTGLVRDYLRGRAELKRLCLLIDARHGLGAADRELTEMLDEAAVAYQGVLTKTDKASAALLAGTRREVAGELARHVAAHPVLAETSARTGAGIAELRADLALLAAPQPLG